VLPSRSPGSNLARLELDPSRSPGSNLGNEPVLLPSRSPGSNLARLELDPSRSPGSNLARLELVFPPPLFHTTSGDEEEVDRTGVELCFLSYLSLFFWCVSRSLPIRWEDGGVDRVVVGNFPFAAVATDRHRELLFSTKTCLNRHPPTHTHTHSSSEEDVATAGSVVGGGGGGAGPAGVFGGWLRRVVSAAGR